MLATKSYAQEKLFKIQYTLDLSEAILSDPERQSKVPYSTQMAALAEAYSDNQAPHYEAWVSPQQFRIQSHLMGKNITLTNKSTGTSFDLNPTLERFSPSDELSQAYSVQLISDSTKFIQGYPCKLAEVRLEPLTDSAEPPIKVWYSEAIPAVYWSDYPYLRALSGAALAIQTDIGLKTIQIQVIAMEESLFEIPIDYSQEQYELQSEPELPKDLGHGLNSYQDAQSQLFGLSDSKQSPLTEPIYTSIQAFVGEYAIVNNAAGLSGLINVQGLEVMPCQWFSLALDKTVPLVFFREDDGMGIMDMQQKILMPAKYEFISPFKHGLSVFSLGNQDGLINAQGEVVLPATHSQIIDYSPQEAIIVENNTFYTIALSTGIRANQGFDYLALSNIPGLFLAHKNGLYGYVDATGHTIIPFKFVYASAFQDGVATVLEKESDLESRYINSKGRYVKTPKALQ